MNRISIKAHGILDYATVLLLAVSPHLFGMPFIAGVFTYSLAFIHLQLTLFTNFELGVFRIIPLYIHGVIEFSVSILLVIVAFLFRIQNDLVSFYFYLAFAVVLFIIWLASSYKPLSLETKLRKLAD